jgi:hypothetical protein
MRFSGDWNVPPKKPLPKSAGHGYGHLLARFTEQFVLVDSTEPSQLRSSDGCPQYPWGIGVPFCNTAFRIF